MPGLRRQGPRLHAELWRASRHAAEVQLQHTDVPGPKGPHTRLLQSVNVMLLPCAAAC